MTDSKSRAKPSPLPQGKAWKRGEFPPELRKALASFLRLKTEDQVLQALVESGVMMVGKPPYGPTEMPPSERAAFKESWDLHADDEVNEALAMAGLVTVGVGDLAAAAKRARYPLTVAKAIVAAARGLDDRLREVVPILRDRGYSWTQIGAALGIAKQSAWERFSEED